MIILCFIINILLPVIATSDASSESGGGNFTQQTCRQKTYLIPVIDATKYLKRKEKRSLFCTDFSSSGFPIDCAELFDAGYVKTGVAKVWPRSRAIEYAPFNVYCDMETDGGGWTVIQRRGNFSRPEDYFFKKWRDYKIGFGSIEEDFWLGNDKIFAFTNQRQYSVRFDLQDVEGENRHALYDTFWIEDEEHGYKLHITDYTGDAGDSMANHNGQKFSTSDVDNDQIDGSGGDCAGGWKGAWWFNQCYFSHLNGLHVYGKQKPMESGIHWNEWKGGQESLAATEIKIRPKRFAEGLFHET